MKRSCIIAGAAALALAGTAGAHDRHLEGNADLYQSPLVEHGPGVRAGQGQKGEGDLYASHLANAEDVTPDPGARPERPAGREALHDQDPEGYGID